MRFDSQLHAYNPNLVGLIIAAVIAFGIICATAGFLTGRLDREEQRSRRHVPSPTVGAHRARPAPPADAPTHLPRTDVTVPVSGAAEVLGDPDKPAVT